MPRREVVGEIADLVALFLADLPVSGTPRGDGEPLDDAPAPPSLRQALPDLGV